MDDKSAEKVELIKLEPVKSPPRPVSPVIRRLQSEEPPAAKKSPSDYKKSLSWESPSKEARSTSQEPIMIAVFLVEKTGRLLTLEAGRNTTAGIINKLMAENLSLNPESAKAFCLWLTSPLLQLQLKAHHRPFILRRIWTELLQKFTNADEETMLKDEPILCYQRNSFYSLAEEKKITDERVIRRLFEEAKYNVFCGAYPIKTKLAVKLGAIMAFIDNGNFEPVIHKPGSFKDKLTEYIPAHLCRGGWRLPGHSPLATMEQKLLREYQDVSSHLSDLYSAHRLYLELCWALPYYGSVFFRGQVERRFSVLSSILGKSDLPVRVAINRERLHVFDEEKNDILVSLAFDELSWDFTPDDTHLPGCLDCFWLEFDADNNKEDSQRLQIFSKQANMMDAMVQSCVACNGNIIESDKDLTTDEDPLEGQVRCRMERLSLSTLEGTLYRQKSTNASFTNPFRRSRRGRDGGPGAEPKQSGSPAAPRKKKVPVVYK